jgi:iron complex outermembrane receptor protein
MRRTDFYRGASIAALIVAASGASAQEALPTIDVGAASPRQSATRPTPGPASQSASPRGEVVVESGGPKDPTAYHVPNSASATKTNTPIMETPVNVQIVPKQVLQDQQVLVIDEAVKNVSGAYSLPYVGLQGGYLIRGFQDYAYYQDGVRVNPFVALPPRDVVDVQQVEVVKGPSSILYGRMQPGGLVEVTTKKPEAEPHYEVQQMFGSYSSYRTMASATGPLTQDKSLLYRIDASFQNEDSFRDGLHNRHFYLAPKILWEPTADTSMTVYAQFYRGRDGIDAGIPALFSPTWPKWLNGPLPGSRSKNYGAADAALASQSDFRFGYNFTHAFNQDWKITHRFDINVRDIPEPWVDVYNPDPKNCSIVSCPVPRDFIGFKPKEQTYFSSLELTGHLDTLAAKHTLLVGADGYHANDIYEYPYNFSTVPSSDLFNPGYPTDLAPYLLLADGIEKDQYRESWYGVYVQDQIKLPYELQVLAGFRYDSARNTTSFTYISPPAAPTGSTLAADAVKPRFGLLWQPIPQLSFYGNYVENFGVNNGVGTNLQPLPPETARQYEAGTKVSLLDDRLTATFAYFDIIKKNIKSPVPGGLPLFSETTGAVRSRGIEIDVQGQVTPEVKIIGSYASTDARIVSSADQTQLGNRWYGVPKNSGSLWAVYEPQLQPLKGFAFGAGFVSRSAVEVDKANSFALPGYAVVDLMGKYAYEYEKQKVTFQLNVNNLLDRTYYVTQGWNGGLIPGTPRTFRGSIKVEF